MLILEPPKYGCVEEGTLEGFLETPKYTHNHTPRTATHYNTLQHHCNTLQNTSVVEGILEGILETPKYWYFGDSQIL